MNPLSRTLSVSFFHCILLGITFSFATNLLGFTRTGTTIATDGSQADVTAAITASVAGDTVTLPAGSFTWGAGGTYVHVNKAITLTGAGVANTTITIDPTASKYSSGAIRITAAAVVRSFATVQSGTTTTTAFSTGATNGWRITNIVHNSGNIAGYFVYAGSYGLIDNCELKATNGSDELIFSRGPSDSWQTTSTLGTANAVFIEDCTFTGPGYVCDFNSNARGVVRFCTIGGSMKIDGHGLASNSPPRGFRHMEIYGNIWTSTNLFSTGVEFRGGTGFIFDNNSPNVDATRRWFYLTEYGCLNALSNFASIYQTPVNYPITDQVGLGMDPKVAASEPVYLWNNIAKGADWILAWHPIPSAAITLYQTQTSNPTATFTMQDVIKADRDYFKHTVGATFNGSSGVGRGTKAEMLAITPSKTGVGFWVTDEGEWNTKQAGPDGQLYVWSGTAWILKYTPYTYPHPGRRPATPSALGLAH